MGGCDEPGPQLDHFLLDILPPSRWWQGCDFPGTQGKSYCHVLLAWDGHLSVFCLLFSRLNLKSSFPCRLSWKTMPKKTHRKAVSHPLFLLFSLTPRVIVRWLSAHSFDCCTILVWYGNVHSIQCIYRKLQLFFWIVSFDPIFARAN